MRLLAVDVATRLPNVGVASGWLDAATGLTHVDAVALGASPELPGGKGSMQEMIDAVAPWIATRLDDAQAVLGLDAPLGWPDPLRAALTDHWAGARLPFPPEAPDRLWRRATDIAIRERLGKTPLEVGADRIARAALAGLELLDAIRRGSERALPLALSPGEPGVIEAYPAGTLAGLGAPSRGYKREIAVREALLDGPLHDAGLRIPPSLRPEALRTEHAFDAVIALLGAADHAASRCPAIPERLRVTAAREGWIFVRRASTDPSG